MEVECFPSGEQCIVTGGVIALNPDAPQDHQANLFTTKQDKRAMKDGYREYIPTTIDRCMDYWRMGFGLNIMDRLNSTYSNHETIPFVTVRMQSVHNCEAIIPLASLARCVDFPRSDSINRVLNSVVFI